MRQLFLALLIALPALADSMPITFTATSDMVEAFGQPWGRTLNLSGTLTTDGVCQICTISETDGAVTAEGGLLSLYITTPGPFPLKFGLGDYGPDAAGDLMSGSAVYDVVSNTLEADPQDFYNEFILLRGSGYHADLGGSISEDGLFSVNPIPEPSAWLFLVTTVIILRITASPHSHSARLSRW
jgi:hypothetical protein